jgi:hypothetical protein
MSDTMTRVQAICACRNIARLCNENERVPDDMSTGILDRATSMEKRLTDNTRYPHITEKMDQALRNMWGGLRKWDRDDEYLDDMFDDLEEVEGEIADLDASAGNKPAPKGREGDDEASKARAQRFQGKEPNVANTPKTQQEDPGPAPEGAGPGAILLSDALRRKESAVGFVLEQIHDAPITCMDKKGIRSMAIGDVLGMTKSDRTQQLIRAAYYVGVLRGVGLLHGKLQNGDE